jgi:hypothetical protein
MGGNLSFVPINRSIIQAFRPGFLVMGYRTQIPDSLSKVIFVIHPHLPLRYVP